MQKKDSKNSMFEMCPVRNVIARFGNKWGFLVLLDINEHGTIRFNELHRVIHRPQSLSGDSSSCGVQSHTDGQGTGTYRARIDSVGIQEPADYHEASSAVRGIS